jgi:hypothetical protein
MKCLLWLLAVLGVAAAVEVDVQASSDDSLVTNTGADSMYSGRTFVVDALLGLLSPPEAMDLGAALDLVSNEAALPHDKKALARAVVPTSLTTVTPLLHYLLGLVPRLSHHAPSREALATLFARLIELGCDPNHHPPNPNEPSLLYKAVFMREVKLALAVLQGGGKARGQGGQERGSKQQHQVAASASGSATATMGSTAARDPDSVLAKLVAAPCDITAFSKLLLHADTVLRSQSEFDTKFAGTDGRRRFVFR